MKLPGVSRATTTHSPHKDKKRTDQEMSNVLPATPSKEETVSDSERETISSTHIFAPGTEEGKAAHV